MNAVGDRIAEARTAKRWGTPPLAHEAGISPSSLSDSESGKVNPQKVTVGKIPAALDVAVNRLLGKTEKRLDTHAAQGRGRYQVKGEATLTRIHFERRHSHRRLVLDADNPQCPAAVPEEGEEVRTVGVAIPLVHRNL